VRLVRCDRSAARLQPFAPYDGRVATTELRTAATAVTPRGAAGGRASRGIPSLRQRMAPTPSPGLAGWLGPIGVAIVAGVLRFYRLGSPHAFVFDETYYAKDAWSLLQHGVELNYVKNANQLILDSKENVFSGSPAFVVHPPAGKWIISVGEQLFGLDPFGWRFAVALLGTLSVLMIARIARRLTGSTVLGCTAGLLLAVDGLHFVMSRTALLDLILMFFVLAAFGCLLIDRDRARERLAVLAERHGGSLAIVAGEYGPRLGWRPWRLLAGVCLGLATATKWSGVYAIVVLAILTFLWDVGARRAVGIRSPLLGALLKDALPALGAILGVAVVVYAASWTGWFLTDDGYDRHWAEGRGTSWPFVPDAVRSLWHYHSEAYDFHTGLKRTKSPHPYMSSPWGWLVLARPVSYYYISLKSGQQGCSADSCSSAVLALGTPALWWLSLGALVFCVWLWIVRRDWRAGAVLAGVAATYLPWFHYTERTIFYFYAVAAAPFLVLAVTLLLGYILGPADAPARRRAIGAGVAGGIVLVIVVTFVYFYPIYSAQVIPYSEWHSRMWFQSWI
jgi:dolichyl-phosphate-mannose-protein mannosyltransferase